MISGETLFDEISARTEIEKGEDLESTGEGDFDLDEALLLLLLLLLEDL